MADTDTDTDTTPPPAPAAANADAINAMLARLQAQGNQPPARVAPVDTDANKPTSWAGILGEHLGGGAPADVDLTKEQREAAGRRSLMSFATGLLSTGTFDTPGQGLAAGLRGAQASQYTSEGLEAQRQVSAQDRQQQQFVNELEVAKQAGPLMTVQLALARLKAMQGLPNPLAGTPGTTPGTQIDPVAGLPKGQALAAIAQRESGNQNIFSSAGDPNMPQEQKGSGYYQIIPSTWRDGAALAGVDVGKYPLAINAPREVQDKVASALWDKYGAVPWAKSAPTPVPAKGTQFAGPGVPPQAAGGQQAPALPVPPIPPPGGPAAPPGAPPDTTSGPVAPAPQGTTMATPPPDASVPDDKLSWPQFQQRHMAQPSPDDIKRITVTTDPKALADATAEVADARKAQATAAQTYQVGLSTGKLDDKATSDFNTANERVATANQNYNKLVQDAATSTAANMLTYQKNQTDILAKQYADAQARAAAVALKTQEGQQKLAEINASSDAQASTKALEDVNEAGRGANQTLQQIDMARQLSKAAGTPNFLEMHTDLFNNLIRTGLVSQDEIQRFGAQQALTGVVNKMVLAARQGSGMSRMTNMDLQFLQNTAPGTFTPEEIREPMLAALQTTYQRQAQYAHIVNALHGKGVPVWDAEQQADEQLGSIIKQPPAMSDIADPAARLEAQGRWVGQNVPIGSFYLKPGGELAIRGATRRPQQ